MKIVINSCYGGFGLSEKAKELYLTKYKEKNKLDNFRIVKPIDKFLGSKMVTLVENDFNFTTQTELYEFLGFSTVALVKNDLNFTTQSELYKLSEEDCIICEDSNLDRTDPILIETIEELGLKESSGDCSELNIEEISSGTQYRIKEYDGYESIEYRDSIDWNMAE